MSNVSLKLSLNTETLADLSAGAPADAAMQPQTWSGECGWSACTWGSCSEVGHTNSCCSTGVSCGC
jgi:hypothetical protein